MYGEEKLNPQTTIMYSLTKEFFDSFQSLKYRGVQLPLILQLPFIEHIRPYVEKKLKNQSYMKRLHQKYQLTSMKQVQKRLGKNPKIAKNFSQMPKRKAILMPARFAATALEAFQHDQVILTVLTKKDEKALKGKELPSSFMTYNVKKVLRKGTISEANRKLLLKKINAAISKQQKHEIFAQPAFKKWLYQQCLFWMKVVHAFDQLILTYPVGVIVHYTSFLNIGIVQALLAKKYGLPFIQCALELPTDIWFTPSRATHHCVWGKHFAEWLKKRGIPSSKISVVGNPRFESEMNRHYMSKQTLLKRLDIPAHHDIFTFMTQELPFEKSANLTIIKWMKKAIYHFMKEHGVKAEELPFTFLIKKHPSDRENNYTDHMTLTNIKIVPSSLHLYDIINCSDFVMTISSNTAIEAILHRKGVIVLQPKLPYHYFFHYNDYHAHLAKASAGFVAKNSTQLSQHMEKLMTESSVRKELIRRGQIFKKNTINPSSNASRLIKKVVHHYLKKNI